MKIPMKRVVIAVLLIAFTIGVYGDALAAAGDYCRSIGLDPGCVSAAPLIVTTLEVALTVSLVKIGLFTFRQLRGELAHLGIGVRR